VFHAGQDEGDLTPRQISVLMAVAKGGGLSQTDIVERTAIDRSTVADLVRRLQKKGLVKRRRTKEDARAYAINLTHEGARIASTAEAMMRRVDERILDALPSKDRGKFLEDLRTIVANLQDNSLA
jgi:DNA-binding MarR family transcriptional regulator